jgi:trk/ktr system potassium uptake protein
MKVVILGLSRFGVQFAQLMRAAGHQISLIDRSSEAFERLPKDFAAAQVLGIGIDEDVMRKAGIEQSDLFVAATDSDNTNLMAAQVAKGVFNIRRSVARVHDEDRAEIFNALGLIEVICPSLEGAKALFRSLGPVIKEKGA